MKHLFLMAIVAVAVAACASTSGKPEQTLQVIAMCDKKPVTEAACTLSNNKGKWETQTPGNVTIQRASGDLTVICTKGEMRAKQTFESSGSAGVWRHVLIGGGIAGAIADASTGAIYVYDKTLQIDMKPPCE